jgi:hypothetical protein
MLYNDWLKELKVGDKVAVNVSKPWEKAKYEINEIEKISPTGRIILLGGIKFNSDGTFITTDKYCGIRLYKITPKILESIEKRNLVNSLKINELIPLLNIENLKILLQWQNELVPKKELVKSHRKAIYVRN